MIVVMTLSRESWGWRNPNSMQFRIRTHGFEMESDKKEIASIKRETVEQLRAALSPKEFQDYQLDQFRETEFGRILALNFSPTEGEFAAIADYTRAQERFMAEGMKDGKFKSVTMQSMKRPSVPTDFPNSRNFKDPGYQEVAAFVNRFGLDPRCHQPGYRFEWNEALRTSYELNNPQGDPAERAAVRERADQLFKKKSIRSEFLEKTGLQVTFAKPKLADWIR